METIRVTEKAAREAQAKADSIAAAVYDLKAVNPNDNAAVYDLKAVNPNDNTKADNRTPAEIIEIIEEQGKIVAAALDRLKNML